MSKYRSVFAMLMACKVCGDRPDPSWSCLARGTLPLWWVWHNNKGDKGGPGVFSLPSWGDQCSDLDLIQIYFTGDQNIIVDQKQVKSCQKTLTATLVRWRLRTKLLRWEMIQICIVTKILGYFMNVTLCCCRDEKIIRVGDIFVLLHNLANWLWDS